LKNLATFFHVMVMKEVGYAKRQFVGVQEFLVRV